MCYFLIRYSKHCKIKSSLFEVVQWHCSCMKWPIGEKGTQHNKNPRQWLPFSPAEVKQGHGDFAQQLRAFPLLVGVWGAAGVLVEQPKQRQAEHGLQRQHSHRDGEVYPTMNKKQYKSL